MFTESPSFHSTPEKQLWELPGCGPERKGGATIKLMEWRPFRKVGQLTGLGVEVVGSKMRGNYPVVWEDYLRNTKTETGQF